MKKPEFDAKYKEQSGSAAIGATDLYEALAFAKACSSPYVFCSIPLIPKRWGIQRKLGRQPYLRKSRSIAFPLLALQCRSDIFPQEEASLTLLTG